MNKESIEEIKRNNPILEYFRSKGVKFLWIGNSNEYRGRCPFHDDKNPSLSVNREKEVFKCFGCGKSGSVIDAVTYFENITIGEAVKLLANKELKTSRMNEATAESYKSPSSTCEVLDKPLEREDPKLSRDIPPGRKLSLAARPCIQQNSSSLNRLSPAKNHPQDNENNHDPLLNTTNSTPSQSNHSDPNLNTIADYYHKKLYENEEALNYLKKRGLKNPKLWQRFKIGYSNNELLSLLGENQKEALKEAGIIRGNGIEHFRGCIVFPILDENDNTVGMYGRTIAEKALIKHLYLKGKHKGVFNRRASKVYNDELLLTESIIDALSLMEIGFDNVQPVYGVNGFTDEHFKILKEDRVKTIAIAFDKDERGQKAGEALKERLVSEYFKVKIITPATCKDWNEEILQGLDKESVKGLLEKAQIYEKERENKGYEVKKEGLGYIFMIGGMHGRAANESERPGGIKYAVSNVKEGFSHSLKVNMRIEYGEERFPDNVDLYSSRSRDALSLKISHKFGIEQKRAEKDLLIIFDYLEAEQQKKLNKEEEKEKELTEEEIKIGMELLKSQNIFKEIIDDVTSIGYVGEDLSKLLLYLCATSRLTEYPVSVLIISQSATGKSFLVDIVKKLIPKNEVITIHSLSDQALNYIKDLMGKFLAFGEAIFNPDVERQIREMLSSKELSRMVVDKDDKTGELMGKIISKQVNVACVMSTTSHNVHPENASRFFIINADESNSQTLKIHEKQLFKYSDERYYQKTESMPDIIKKHHAAQRLLRKLHIVIPEVMRKLIKFPYHSLRTRRDHERFIDLMACICFLRQYQKQLKQFKDGAFYVECDHIDYEVAKMIMINKALTSTLSEIPEGAVRLYDEIRKMVRAIAEKKGLKPVEVTFSQRDVREFTGYGQSFIKQNLRLLVEYEYLNRVRGGTAKGSRGFYRLKADEEMIKLDLSMLVSGETIKKALEERKNAN